MKVLNFIIVNWDLILLIAAAVVAIIFAIFKGNKPVVMRMLYHLVTEAEQAYGSGTGALKLAAVIDAIYPKLPLVIKLFITDDMLVKWVETALAKAKEAWKESIASDENGDKLAEREQTDDQNEETNSDK